jgi:hypothetical protein
MASLPVDVLAKKFEFLILASICMLYCYDLLHLDSVFPLNLLVKYSIDEHDAK